MSMHDHCTDKLTEYFHSYSRVTAQLPLHSTSATVYGVPSHKCVHTILVSMMTYYIQGTIKGHDHCTDKLILTVCTTSTLDVMSHPVDCVFQARYHEMLA